MATLLASLCLSTCRKLGSRKFDDSGRDVAQQCLIKTMTGFLDKRTLQRTFEYNDQNNPVKVMYVGVENDDITPTYIFTYNKINQLVSYDNSYSSHKFI